MLTAGFTLIELLVVMLILGILAAMAIGMYQHDVQEAQVAAERSDLRNAIDAVQACYSDNLQYPTQWGAAVDLTALITPTGSPPYTCQGNYKGSPNDKIGYMSDVAGDAFLVYNFSFNNTAGGRQFCYISTGNGIITEVHNGYTPDIDGFHC